MTIISAVLGILASAMPILLKLLDARLSKPVERLPARSYTKQLQEVEDEESIEITWAEHDADLEQLL
jgi:hypothetical protein